MSNIIKDIRNIAIIAHVDHGKTTLVDHLLRQSGTFRENQATEERMMDSMDLERERGITIAAKNAAFVYNDVKINIVDTPGHSDFGGEVERVLNMVDGAVLLVDASEGPLPQTRFVLKKALEQNIKIIVCINKIDRPDARIQEVENEIFDLFIDLDATDEQMDYKTVYAVAREGYATTDPSVKTDSLRTLFDLILNEVPRPLTDSSKPLQILCTNIDYSDYVGRLGVGRIRQGTIKVGSDLVCHKADGQQKKSRVTALYAYSGMRQVAVEEMLAGDIAVFAGFEDVQIGDSITLPDTPPLTRILVEEPTVGMIFSVNDGPFAGLEGDHVTSRKIWERLEKELRYNVSIRVEKTDRSEAWKVLGRGELQLAVVIETMRREGYELLVSKPQVILKKENGVLMEPMESVVVDLPDQYVGAVTEKLGGRKGVMTNMINKGSGRVRIEFSIPTRGLIGYRSEFLTDTRGLGLLNTHSAGYSEHRGEIEHRKTGAMIADRKGPAIAYALWYLQERGKIFVSPQTECYEGMIVGEHAKANDLVVNVNREKKLSNVRASGTDEAVRLVPVKPMTLEFAMEWVNDDELIEVTPDNIRLRCRELNPHKRGKKIEVDA
jgi:GTP-binding protein